MFDDIVDTVIAWSDEILAWRHPDRAGDGRIEGANNLQVLRRTAHGFANPTNFRSPRLADSITTPTGAGNPQSPATLNLTFTRRAKMGRRAGGQHGGGARVGHRGGTEFGLSEGGAESPMAMSDRKG